MDRKITDLEIRFMHQERTIQELNDIVCRQELAIERLERDMRTLQEQVKQLVPSLTRTAEEEEAPPHY
jgi:SlyX protein